MEILWSICRADSAARVCEELTGQSIKIRLVCKDPTGFLEVDGGLWRDMNKYILESGLIVDQAGTDSRGIALEGCALRITYDEFKYFNVEIVMAEGA